jgi:hypothetical protein
MVICAMTKIYQREKEKQVYVRTYVQYGDQSPTGNFHRSAPLHLKFRVAVNDAAQGCFTGSQTARLHLETAVGKCLAESG